MVCLSALGSGSRGNALVLSSPDGALIVDVGFSRREVRTRMERLGLDPCRLRAALLTHEHDDHSRGCRVFCDELNIPLCTASPTAEYLRRRGKLPGRVLEFEPGCEFQIGGFEVEPFAVQHDAVAPVGFVVRREGVKIGIATDLGNVNMLAMQRLEDCDALVLESNYCPVLLDNSSRPYSLKMRIKSSHGHLSNADAIELMAALDASKVEKIFLAHISKECNNMDHIRELLESSGRLSAILNKIEIVSPFSKRSSVFE